MMKTINIKSKIDDSIKLKKFSSMNSGSIIICNRDETFDNLTKKIINEHKDKDYTIINTLKYSKNNFADALLEDVNRTVTNDKSLFIIKIDDLNFDNTKVYAAYLTLLKYSAHNNVKVIGIGSVNNFKSNKNDYDFYIQL